MRLRSYGPRRKRKEALEEKADATELTSLLGIWQRRMRNAAGLALNGRRNIIPVKRFNGVDNGGPRFIC